MTVRIFRIPSNKSLQKNPQKNLPRTTTISSKNKRNHSQHMAITLKGGGNTYEKST